MDIPDVLEGIPVLVERPADTDTGWLLAANNAWLEGGDPTPFMQNYAKEHPIPGFQFDLSYGAIAIGTGEGFVETTLADLLPEKSKSFLVRGFIKVDAGAPGPERLADGLVHSDPAVGGFLTCGNSPAVGDTARVLANLRAKKLWDAGYDGSRVAIAIVDTGIYLNRLVKLLGDPGPGTVPANDAANSWTPKKPKAIATKPFRHRLGHGTMCAYDALIAAPKATLLDIAMLLATPGGHNVPLTVAAATKAFWFLQNKWHKWSLMGPERPFDALVVNNSWGTFHPDLDNGTGFARYIDNPKHYFRLHLVKPMAQAGVDIVFASNNCGSECRSATCLGQSERMIMGANTYKEVLTVGGCDTNNNRVGYSSKGPSIQHMFQEKPDITSYTHFLGSKTRRIRAPDTGVSAACPVAAGCVAALRTGLPPSTTPPKTLFEALKSTATRGNGGGPGGQWNPEYGYGIINPVGAAQTLGLVV